MSLLKQKSTQEACPCSFGMQIFKRLKETIKAIPRNYGNDVGQQGLLISILLYGNEKGLQATCDNQIDQCYLQTVMVSKCFFYQDSLKQRLQWVQDYEQFRHAITYGFNNNKSFSLADLKPTCPINVWWMVLINTATKAIFQVGGIEAWVAFNVICGKRKSFLYLFFSQNIIYHWNSLTLDITHKKNLVGRMVIF